MFGLIIEYKGSGIRSSSNARVEKVDPVGVKLKACAKSNGINNPKKDNNVTRATADALAYIT